MANSKEVVLKSFKREKTEYVPVGAFLGGSWPIINSGLTLESLIGDVQRTAQAFYEVNERINADILMVGVGSTALLIKALGGEVRFDNKGAPQIISELIKNEDDLSQLSISKAFNAPQVLWLRDVAKEVLRLSEEKRLILASGRAPFTLATQLFGLEKFSKAIYKNPELVHKILEFTTELSLSYFKFMIEEGNVHGAFIADPSASGDVISKKHFEKFVLPYLEKVVQGIKEHKKPVLLHICGDITDRLSLIASSGIDSLSIDTKVDLAKAMEIIGDEISVAWNVDPVNVLEFGTEEDVISATSQCISKGTTKRGFILLPGCDLAGDVPEHNIKTFIDTAHRWNIN
jgi:uroporphyrinogen decarboxylase